MVESPVGRFDREVPDITGVRAHLAASILTQAGFTPLFIDASGAQTAFPAPDSIVESQMPSARRQASLGSQVALYLR